MVSEAKGDWRDQLSKVKDRVVEVERRKALEDRLKIERTKEGLTEQVQKDSPEVLQHQFRELQDAFRAGGRELYPVDTMLAASVQLDELGDRVELYLDSIERFQDVFPAAYVGLLPRLKAGVESIRERSGKQVQEWANVKIVTDGTAFREKREEDEPTLVHVAQTFYKKAHGIDLNLPKQFFAKKAQGFYVATFQGIPYAYVEVGDIKGTCSIVVGEVLGTNFSKLVRGFMYAWCRKGPLGKIDSLSVRVTSRDEVKFYTALNFLRTRTLGMSDWTYARKVV